MSIDSIIRALNKKLMRDRKSTYGDMKADIGHFVSDIRTKKIGSIENIVIEVYYLNSEFKRVPVVSYSCTKEIHNLAKPLAEEIAEEQVLFLLFDFIENSYKNFI